MQQFSTFVQMYGSMLVILGQKFPFKNIRCKVVKETKNNFSDTLYLNYGYNEKISLEKNFTI